MTKLARDTIPSVEVERLGAQFRTHRQAIDELHPQLIAAMRAAHASGAMRQVDMVKATGLTREMVRRICRSAVDHDA